MKDTEKRKRYFKEGDEVAHKEALTTKMEVRKIVRRVKASKSKEEPDRVFILGVECGWWNSGNYHKEVFHTHTLVPWEIAECGYIDVQKYIDSINNINE